MRILYPKSDPLLSSSMQRASLKYETPRLELKSSRTFRTINKQQTLWADKNWKSYQAITKLVIKVVAYLRPWGYSCFNRVHFGLLSFTTTFMLHRVFLVFHSQSPFCWKLSPFLSEPRARAVRFDNILTVLKRIPQKIMR